MIWSRRLASGALLVLAAFGWWADRNLPWLLGLAGRGTYEGIGRTDILAGQLVAYEAALLHLSTLAWGLLGAVGLIFVGMEFRRPGRHEPLTRRALLGVSASAGLFLLVAASRWLGFYHARLWDTGQTIVHLHFIPYFHLIAGSAVLAWSLYSLHPEGVSILPSRLMEPAVRTPLALTWLAAAVLVTMPLLPHAIGQPIEGKTFHYDELTIAVLASEDGPAVEVAESLAYVRAATWAILAISVTTLILSTWRSFLPDSPTWRAFRGHLPWLTLPAFAVLAFHGVRLLAGVPRLAAEVRTGPNFVPQVAALGFLALLVAHAHCIRNASQTKISVAPDH